MKKICCIVALSVLLLQACSSTTNGAGAAGFGGPITVISRESGSGTRGAFIDLFGIQEKDDSGNKTDKTTKEAIIASKTDVAIQHVVNDKNAIGYISLGSLSDEVKALQVDGAEATAENIITGSYSAARPFLLAAKGEPDEMVQDFISFILSEQGQSIVADGYIPVDLAAPPYTGTGKNGKIVIAGSSSVSPVMEKLRESYLALHPDAEIEIQTSDSTAGIQALIDGNCDIGMASRELKEEELKQVNATQIAMDGIAIIVNQDNPLENITSKMVHDIYIGAVTDWAGVKSE